MVKTQTQNDLVSVSPAEDTLVGETVSRPAKLNVAKTWLMTLGLLLAVFMVALDGTIIAIAIPTISADFGDLKQAGWYGTSYQLALTAFQLSSGKVYNNFNLKWSFMVALLFFEGASTICATSINSAMLVVGRAVAGAAASMLFTGGMLIIEDTIPLTKRPIYIASLSSVFGLSAVLGPILGGLLTQKLSWRWCFWINLPLGVIPVVGILPIRLTPARNTPDSLFRRLANIGFLDLLLLSTAILFLLLGLQYGGASLPWRHPRIIGFLVGFVVLLSIFVCLQVWRRERRLLPIELLRQRTVLSCSCFTMFLSMATFTHMYYLPYLFEAVKAMSVQQAGIVSCAYLLSGSVATATSGAITTLTGIYAPLMWLGSLTFVVGSTTFLLLGRATPIGLLVASQILSGIGFGTATQIPFIAVQTVLGKGQIASGTALIFFCNSLGATVALAIAQSIFTNSVIDEISAFASKHEALAILELGFSNWSSSVTSSDLAITTVLAFEKSIRRTFILPVVGAALAFVVSLMVERKNIKTEAKVRQEESSPEEK